MGQRVYIHEYINIIGANRANYFRHMTTDWGHIGRSERRQLCFGVWGTVGSTGRWPEVVNLWEYQSWEDLAENFSFETGSDTMQDKSLERWWLAAQQYRSGGFDRLLVPALYSPGIEQICEQKRIGAKVFLHEIVNVRPGSAQDYLALMEEHWLASAEELGLSLVGAFRTSMRNDSEVVLIWSMQEWSDWAKIQNAEQAPVLKAWRDRSKDIALDWSGHLMCSAPASPLRTGVQP